MLMMLMMTLMMMIHPCRHYEIRLSLTQLCDVNKASRQLLGSVKCAPHSFGVDSSPSSGARHRGVAPSRGCHDAADRVAKAAGDGYG